jgi:hypothetical protein
MESVPDDGRAAAVAAAPAHFTGQAATATAAVVGFLSEAVDAIAAEALPGRESLSGRDELAGRGALAAGCDNPLSGRGTLLPNL